MAYFHIFSSPFLTLHACVSPSSSACPHRLSPNAAYPRRPTFFFSLSHPLYLIIGVYHQQAVNPYLPKAGAVVNPYASMGAAKKKPFNPYAGTAAAGSGKAKPSPAGKARVRKALFHAAGWGFYSAGRGLFSRLFFFAFFFSCLNRDGGLAASFFPHQTSIFFCVMCLCLIVLSSHLFCTTVVCPFWYELDAPARATRGKHQPRTFFFLAKS